MQELAQLHSIAAELWKYINHANRCCRCKYVRLWRAAFSRFVNGLGPRYFKVSKFEWDSKTGFRISMFCLRVEFNAMQDIPTRQIAQYDTGANPLSSTMLTSSLTISLGECLPRHQPSIFLLETALLYRYKHTNLPVYEMVMDQSFFSTVSYHSNIAYVDSVTYPYETSYLSYRRVTWVQYGILFVHNLKDGWRRVTLGSQTYSRNQFPHSKSNICS